jgi:hypothetical protein
VKKELIEKLPHSAGDDDDEANIDSFLVMEDNMDIKEASSVSRKLHTGAALSSGLSLSYDEDDEGRQGGSSSVPKDAVTNTSKESSRYHNKDINDHAGSKDDDCGGDSNTSKLPAAVVVVPDLILIRLLARRDRI